MYAKLALRNIKRSVRDYAVYFLTIVFAVAVFYVFGSLADQPAVIALHKAQTTLAVFLINAMSYISVFVAIVMAVLVLYANNFLIRKRQKEIGTYLLLGMRQRNVARLIFIESVLIGLVSLAVGILLGIALSQAFSYVVAYLLEAKTDHFQFIFSLAALQRATILFGLIYLLAGILSSLSIVRLKLIDLITGDRKNEEIKFHHPASSILAGTISLCAIGYAYYLAISLGRTLNINPSDPRFWRAVVLGILGTYGMFYAFSGLIIGVFKHFKRIYLHGLNMFTLRQVTCKVAGNAWMLATIALMLTVTLCSFAVGLGINSWMKSMINIVAPDDVVISSQDVHADFRPVYRAAAANGQSYSARVQVIYHKSGVLQTAFLSAAVKPARQKQGNSAKVLPANDTLTVSLSDYNALRRLKHLPAISLSPGQYALHSCTGNEDFIPSMNAYLSAGYKLLVDGKMLVPGAQKMLTEHVWGYMDIKGGSQVVLIVNDAVASELPTVSKSVFIDYPGDSAASLDGKIGKMATANHLDFISRSMIKESFGGVAAIFVFAGFYIGVIFLIASAAVLAVQQLADASDHKRRFEMVKKLGADDAMISHALLKQISFYFLIPCIVGLIHTMVGLYALNKMFLNAEGFSLVGSFLMAAAIVVVIYGIYYIATYLGYKNILKYSSSC